MSPLAEYIAQAAVTLVGVALVAWLIVYTGRRAGYHKDSGSLRLRGRLTLEGRRALYLVEVSDKILVLGASEAGLTKLAELDREALPELPPASSRSFASVLAQTFGRGRLASEAEATSEVPVAARPAPEEEQR